jgi:hypothetical protein
MEMKIVDVRGPTVDQYTFQPHMRLTIDLPLTFQDKTRSEDENALVFYRAFMKATQIWQQKTETV